MTTTAKIVTAIDPDVERCGVVTVDREKRAIVYAASLTFPDVIKYLEWLAAQPGAVLVLEDSAFTTHNWHINRRDTIYKAAAIGRAVGMCHATARHLKETAESMSIKTELVRPFIKTWNGPGGKISHAEAAIFMRGLPTRTNQDTRDAALLAWAYANLPIFIKL